MPYRLRKVPNKDLYWVIGEDGKHHSKEGLPKERAMAQMSALYIVWRKGKELKGGSHQTRIAGVPLKTYYEAAKASYAIKNNHHPPKHIGDAFLQFTLVHSTRTLVFYVHEGGRRPKLLVGIRGTDPKDTKDLGADALIATNSLTTSDRYKHDLETMKKMYKDYPHEDGYYWIGVGHSLGGAILDHFIKEGYIKTGVSYNPAVEKPFYNSSANHRIYNEHDPLYWFMGSYAKVYDVRKDTRPSDWVDYLSWISPWWKVGYTALSAHRLSNFEGGMRGGLTADEVEASEPIKKQDLFEPDMKFETELEDDAKENDALYTSLMGAGEWNCPDALPIYFRPDGTRQFEEETCDVVNGIFDKITKKCAKKDTNPVQYYDDTCKKDEVEISKKQEKETIDRKKKCSGTNRPEPPYVGTPAKDVGDSSIPRKYADNDWRVYTPEDCAYLKGTFIPFETAETNQFPVWQRDTYYSITDVNVKDVYGDAVWSKNERTITLKNADKPLLDREIPESHYNPGSIRWYNNKKYKAVLPKSIKPGVADGFVDFSGEDVINRIAPPLTSGPAARGLTFPDLYYRGYWPSETFTLMAAQGAISIEQNNKGNEAKLDKCIPWRDGQSYEYGKRVYTEDGKISHDNVSTTQGFDRPSKYGFGKFKIWIAINQQNIPPTEGGWEEMEPTEEEKIKLQGMYEDGEPPWRSPIEKSYTEKLETVLKGQWGDCVVNNIDMNSYCAPLNSEYTTVPKPDVGVPYFGPNIDADMNDPNKTYTEQEFNEKRAWIQNFIQNVQKTLGDKKRVIVNLDDYNEGLAPPEYRDDVVQQGQIDQSIRSFRESNVAKTFKPPLNKDLDQWVNYGEFKEAAEKYWLDNTLNEGEYSPAQLKELGDYSKIVNKCPEALKWDLGRPYTGNERICFEEEDDTGYGLVRKIDTFKHATGLDIQSKCYLPEKPNGTWGRDIASDDKGKYIMANPDDCYARQMALFKEVSDSDWWPGDPSNANITQLWRRYASQGYDKLTGYYAGVVSNGIKDYIQKNITAAKDQILPEWWTEVEKKKKDAAKALDDQMSQYFSGKFGIPPEKMDNFWKDLGAALAEGKSADEFFEQTGSTYSNPAFNALATETERSGAAEAIRSNAAVEWERAGQEASGVVPRAPQEELDRIAANARQAVQDMRRDTERVVVNLPNLPQSLPASPRESDVTGDDLPDPYGRTDEERRIEEELTEELTRPPTYPPNLFGTGGKAVRGRGYDIDYPQLKDDFVSGMFNPFDKDSFWTSPESFVHKINQHLGLTGESDTEQFAKRYPKAPGQKETIPQGMLKSISNDLENPQDWNERAKTLLQRREEILRTFPTRQQLGYDAIGKRYQNMGAMEYSEATGVKPPPGAVVLPAPTAGSGKGKAKNKFVVELESEGIAPAKYLAEAQKKAKKAGLDWKCLTWATDGKHKLEVPHEGKVVRFGAAGMGDHIFYKLAGDPTADSHRKAYRARATKINGDWASNKYSPNSLAIAVLW